MVSYNRYLVLSLLLIGLSFVLTTLVINLHYRKPSTHTMPDWVRRVFIKTLPRLLLMKVPIQVIKDSMKSRRSKFLRQSDPALKSLQGEYYLLIPKPRQKLVLLVGLTGFWGFQPLWLPRPFSRPRKQMRLPAHRCQIYGRPPDSNRIPMIPQSPIFQARRRTRAAAGTAAGTAPRRRRWAGS